MFDPQPTDELPPPSYEVSQETFDQKTRQGIQASLDPQANAHDLWEEWDEAKFEANARAFAETSASSSSSSSPPRSLPPVTAQQYPREKPSRPSSLLPPRQEEPAVRPLRIVKKSQMAAYKKAVEAKAYHSNALPGGPPSSSDEVASLTRSFSVLSAGRRTPPPMFESVGPSLDGPDYEEVVKSYVPGNSRPSSPMSVLSTNSYRPPVPPPPPIADSRPNRVRPSPPPPPIQRQPAQKPTPTQAQRSQHQQPRRRVGFDPMSAYKSKPAFTPDLEPTPEKVDPSSFYNSAVSAHISTVPQRSAITPAYRTNRTYQQELQHPRPHHAVTFDNFGSMGDAGGMSMGRERAMSVISTDSSYYPNPPVNLSPNRGWGYQPQPLHPNR